jgi:hypothetical protein
MGPATESRFSQAERRLLVSVLDEIIPPRADAGLPGAGALGVVDYVERALGALPELRAMIKDGLRDVDDQARRDHARSFPELVAADKAILLGQHAFVLPLSMQAYVGYYHDARVLQALGLAARAPHPQGYEMEGNDLTLLDGVRRRPKLYRRVSR